MRQNGLRASSFVAVADVDPRIADQLLDLLAFAHVAAYAEPVPGRVGVYRDHHVPTRPIDRLWVDREATGPAREVLDRSLAHLHAELETAIAEGVLAGGTTTDRRGQPAGPGTDRGADVSPGTDGAGPDAVGTGTPATDGSPRQHRATDEPAPAPASDVSASGAPASEVPGSEVAGSEAGGVPVPGAAATVDAPTRDAPPPGAPARHGESGAGGLPTPVEPATTGDAPTGTAGTTGDGALSEPPPVHGEGLDQAAVDARWRDIVAGWDGPAADGRGSVIDTPTGRRSSAPIPPPHPPGFGTPWPSTAPSAPQPGDRRRTDRGPIDPARRRENRVDGRPVDLPGPRAHTPTPEDEHFSPPAPSVHPPLEKTTRLGWAGLVAGLVVLVVVVAVGSELLPRWVPLLGVALLVGGFAALVSRLHRSPPDEDDDDPDDGAVV